MNNETPYSDFPSLLDVLRYAREFETGVLTPSGTPLRIAIVTNFTDDLLRKAVTGLCAESGITPHIYSVPFKQYHFELKRPDSPLATHSPHVTCVFFSVTDYESSEFITDPAHLEETITDLERLCRDTPGTVLIQTCLTQGDVQHGRLLKASPASKAAAAFNARIATLNDTYPNVCVISTDTLALSMGVSSIYDLRNLYASSQPYTNEFLYRLAREWFAVIRSLSGKARKCIVVDLDNTLWGGILGEVGPLGITLGPEYPGNAFVAFQRVLLQYYEQGIILAINSRNNLADVQEVFEKNPHMVLKESHFACIVANWENKADNLRHIATELNIGLDSLVFIDDDPMNRDLVRTQLPEVSVPYFSLAPEEYAHALLNLDYFHRLTETEEDTKRGEMYGAERKRKELLAETPSMGDYLATLDLRMVISVNDAASLPRLAQMTQKTNQFNLTTARSTEVQIQAAIESGAFVYGGDVTDKFGSYGLTIMAIYSPRSATELSLDTCLMSCRIMGRTIEYAFFKAVATDLLAKGYKTVHARFIPTDKNAPARAYLAAIGGVAAGEESGAQLYTIDLATVVREKNEPSAVQVNLIP